MLPSLLFVIACGTSPALLSDMGEVDATVVYRSSNGVAAGWTEVSLVAHEGCPTFLGEALLNDEPMVVDDGGHSDLQWVLLIIPLPYCAGPHFSLAEPAEEDDVGLTVTVQDLSDSWQIGSDDAYAFGYEIDVTEVEFGSDLVIPWTGPVAPTNVAVMAESDGGTVYIDHVTGDDGTLTFSLPEDDLAPGPIMLTIDADVWSAAPNCSGFAACELIHVSSWDWDLVVG